MDFELRRKALARLTDSTSKEADDLLRAELAAVLATLQQASGYEELTQGLQLLGVFAHRFSEESIAALRGFLATLTSRQIVDDPHLGLGFGKRGANELIRGAIEVLVTLKYFEPRAVLDLLIELSSLKDRGFPKVVHDALRRLATYDLHAFYGQNAVPGMGAGPQKEIIDEISSFSSTKLRAHLGALLVVLDELLSPTMEGTSWSYNAVTLSRSTTPALPEVTEIRSGAIRALQVLFAASETVADRLRTIAVLGGATRVEVHQSLNDETTLRMYANNGVEVLTFFSSIVSYTDLPVVQKIEHDSYWIYYHALSDEVRIAARKVRDEIERNAEYQIYKVLIGFEGIFGEWNQPPSAEARDETDRYRRARANEFASSVDGSSYAVWRNRILTYAETESADLATFPVFYEFLEQFAIRQPTLALRLVRQDSEALTRFLVPLLRGLWRGPESPAIRNLADSWIRDGAYLSQVAQQFLLPGAVDVDVLERILKKATERADVDTIALITSVAISRYGDYSDASLTQLFLRSVEALSTQRSAVWVLDAWHKRQVRTIMAALSGEELDLLIDNLRFLLRIDYHAEEVLYAIANRDSARILAYLIERLSRNGEERMPHEFEAIPYEFHNLGEPLSRDAKSAVEAVRASYDGNYAMFVYRGARLLKLIFPTITADFQSELLRLVEGDQRDLEVVLAVLRNYEGEAFVYPVCREVIKRLPERSEWQSEVAAALEATGVVRGEYGFVEAYERKKKEIAVWSDDPDGRLRDFAERYIRTLDQMIANERKRADEGIALRKFRFGEQAP